MVKDRCKEAMLYAKLVEKWLDPQRNSRCLVCGDYLHIYWRKKKRVWVFLCPTCGANVIITPWFDFWSMGTQTTRSKPESHWDWLGLGGGREVGKDGETYD